MENGVTDIDVFQISHREITEDGKELVFDHGAPLFTVSNPDVLGIVREWEARGLVAEWKENFASFDCISRKFIDFEKVYPYKLNFSWHMFLHLYCFNNYNISKNR